MGVEQIAQFPSERLLEAIKNQSEVESWKNKRDLWEEKLEGELGQGRYNGWHNERQCYTAEKALFW